MKLQVKENKFLREAIDDVRKYYPNIPDDIFMQLISLDPTYRDGSNSLGKYGKWILNLFNRGKITDNDFDEIPNLLNQFTIYKNRIQNKDLNSYKTLDDLAEILASVVNDDSMLTPSQKTKFLKRVKSGKIKVDKSDDYDVVLDTPNFIVYVPNTHEASMKLGKGTEWCTAHENPDWYDSYTENGGKLYIVKNKKTGERWQYSDESEDFLDQDDNKFDVFELMKLDKKLSKYFEKFLGIDLFNFDGIWIYDGNEVPNTIKNFIKKIIIENTVTYIDDWVFANCKNLTNVTIPGSIKRIGNKAFALCENLTDIIIPNSVTQIGEMAFIGCKGLTNVNISDNTTHIGKGAFSGCFGLTNITIPDSVTYIDDMAFAGCINLKSVTIYDSVADAGESIFRNCNSLVVYTNNEYIIDYCKEYDVPVKSISEKPKTESYRKPNKLKLMIRE